MIPQHSRPPFALLDAVLAGAAFVLALATRLHFVLTSPDRDWPHSAWFEGDAPLWAQWAGALAKGEEFERGLAIHAPGVAYFLRSIGYDDTSTDFTGAKVLWCAASALACSLTFLALRMETRRRPAAIAAGLCAFSFASYETAASLNGEAIYSMLVPLVVLGTLALSRRPSLFLGTALGLAHGAALLVRPEHPLLAALMGLFLLWRWRGPGFVRRLPAAAAMTAVALAVILPWTLKTAAATERFNTVAPPGGIDFAAAAPPWTPDAREALNALPAFARADNFGYLNFLALRRGQAQITAPDLQNYFTAEFAYTPEPLAKWTLISGQGPLCFALANHPKASGGFSKAALDDRFGPSLAFGLPSHLYLYNRGYRAGWDSIRADPARWATLVARKVALFTEGATQGLTLRNWPAGHDGLRRAVDTFTAPPPLWWRTTLAGLFAIGLVVAATGRMGGLWSLVIASKIVTTILFFGYARQAASIAPAFAVFVALGIDGVLLAIGSAWRRSPPRRAWNLLWLAPLAALLALDLTATHPLIAPRPEMQPAPRFGPEAFTAPVDLPITTIPPGPPPAPAR